MCNSISELIQVIERSKAEYPSVLLHKDNWMRIIAEIKELKKKKIEVVVEGSEDSQLKNLIMAQFRKPRDKYYAK